MASFPAEILLGIYLGLLVGTVPALCTFALGFGVRYRIGVTLPEWGIAPAAVVVAALNGVVLAGTPLLQAPTAPAIGTALLVVGALSVYTHDKGTALAAELPQRFSLSEMRSDSLALERAELVDGGDEVRIRVVGEVADMEGYPPLSADLRAQLRHAELTLPADLQLDELEERTADRLQTEYDLGDVSVTIDERGRATVVAAPPFSGLSKQVEDGKHAVSVTGLVPTGLARGDEVTVITPNAQVRGTVLSAETESETTETPDIDPLSTDEPAEEDLATPIRAPTTSGGEGRLTVAVTRTDVQPLLRASEVKVVVESRGTRREYEVVSMLRRADRRFRRVSVNAASPLAGMTLGHADLRDSHDISVVAVRTASGWQIGPSGETTLEPGDELFAVGTRESLDSFSGKVT